jgi:hypothetical protein
VALVVALVVVVAAVVLVVAAFSAIIVSIMMVAPMIFAIGGRGSSLIASVRLGGVVLGAIVPALGAIDQLFEFSPVKPDPTAARAVVYADPGSFGLAKVVAASWTVQRVGSPNLRF